jgi:hypothetical protein
MEEWLCRQNIERLRNQLATACDERQRRILSELLSEQEAKLRRITSSSAMSGPPQSMGHGSNMQQS